MPVAAPPKQSALERLITDKQFFIENVLMIEDKDRVKKPFVLKPIQQAMIESMTGRDVYLKPAQVGSTSLFMACFLHDCLTRPGTNAVVVAHEEFITQRLLGKVHFFIDNLPPGFAKPHHKSSYEITWPDLHSSFYIGSARSYVFGRGEVIHDLLCSEYAFWPDTARILGPALERVPPSGRIIIESTPNGDDNDFAKMYQMAKERIQLGTSRFTPHFYPWTLEPDYRLPWNSPYALPIDRHTPLELTNDELAVVEKLYATEDQIRWRRMKTAELDQLRSDGQSSLLFAQEFPEDDVSCFLATGDCAFDLDMIKIKLAECYKAPKQWCLP